MKNAMKMLIVALAAFLTLGALTASAVSPITATNLHPVVGETVTVDASALVCNFPPCRTVITVSWTDALHANHVLATIQGSVVDWTFGATPPTVIFLAKSTGSNKAHSFTTAQLNISVTP